jgi:hypothetical protein
MQWQPISIFDFDKMQYVLVYQDEAIRAYLWNPYKRVWESPTPVGYIVTKMDECNSPTHWMPTEDLPNSL